MGGQKPHLLVGVSNNLGAETRVTYAPSTKFYLADKIAGQPWITRLPFPVQVVERVETFDCDRPQPLRHPLRLPPRLLRRRGARVPRLRHGRAVGHRGVPRRHQFRRRRVRQLGRAILVAADAARGPGSTPARSLEAPAVTSSIEAEYWIEPALRARPPTPPR